MEDPFVAAHIKAINDYLADLEQISSLRERLLASAKGVKREKTPDKAKIDKLSTIQAQMERLPQQRKEIDGRFLKAKDAANAIYVVRVKGLSAYCMGTGRDDAAIRLLASICKDFDSAKGDFSRRQALYDEISETMSAAVGALDKREGTAALDNSIIGQLEAIDDPEQRTSFYKKYRTELLGVPDDHEDTEP